MMLELTTVGGRCRLLISKFDAVAETKTGCLINNLYHVNESFDYIRDRLLADHDWKVHFLLNAGLEELDADTIRRVLHARDLKEARRIVRDRER